MEGLGVHRFWGASPAVDLAQTFDAVRAGDLHDVQGDELVVLVCGAGDVRHAIRTFAALRRSGRVQRKVRLVLFDTPIESIARHLLLLAVFTDWKTPIRTRANTWLEVFGNALLQERTSQYVAELGRDLIRFVCNGHGSLARLVDLSLLRFKDTDALETIFKSWGDKVPFDIKELWDQRLRALHGQRYDNRAGLVDWDYQNGFKAHASIIHYKQYRHWRETGVAFEFGDQTYTTPNRSLASYAHGKEGGVSRLRRGYWSDVVVGPYLSLGVSCETPNQHARDLFKVLNKGTATEQHRHTAVHVSAYNVLGMMHEVETGRQYKMALAHDVYSGLDQHSSKWRADEGQAMDAAGAPALRTAQDREAELADKQEFALECARSVLEHKDLLSIVLATGDSFSSTFSKKRFQGAFDMVWLSTYSAHLIKEPVFASLLRGPGRPVVMVETPRNMVMLQTGKKREYLDKVRALAQSTGMEEWVAPSAPADADLEALVFTAAPPAPSDPAQPVA